MLLRHCNVMTWRDILSCEFCKPHLPSGWCSASAGPERWRWSSGRGWRALPPMKRSWARRSAALGIGSRPRSPTCTWSNERESNEIYNRKCNIHQQEMHPNVQLNILQSSTGYAICPKVQQEIQYTCPSTAGMNILQLQQDIKRTDMIQGNL